MVRRSPNGYPNSAKTRFERDVVPDAHERFVDLLKLSSDRVWVCWFLLAWRDADLEEDRVLRTGDNGVELEITVV